MTFATPFKKHLIDGDSYKALLAVDGSDDNAMEQQPVTTKKRLLHVIPARIFITTLADFCPDRHASSILSTSSIDRPN
jgi:hypothetical protein